MIYRLLILVLLFSCSKDYQWDKITIDDAIRSIDEESNKLILLDFYADQKILHKMDGTRAINQIYTKFYTISTANCY